ncbi:hypothetical protein CL614_09270 [archaeon]|nr:hypothetical protein [archaeon]|tara:strand:- start:533 stop:871 length:339 start_codon:yes stop_codon:yes gene_type:complete
MTYKKSELKKLKEKLKKDKPNIFTSIKKPTNIKVERKIIKSDSYSKRDNRKSMIWNYNINDLIIIKKTEEVGLIIANDTYFNQKCKQNYFFVLMGSKVIECYGKSIKKLHEL